MPCEPHPSDAQLLGSWSATQTRLDLSYSRVYCDVFVAEKAPVVPLDWTTVDQEFRNELSAGLLSKPFGYVEGK